MYMYICVWAGAFEWVLQRPEEDAGAARTGVTSGCRRPNDSVGNQTQFLCKNTAFLTTELSLEPSLYQFYVTVEEFSFWYFGLEVVYH